LPKIIDFKVMQAAFLTLCLPIQLLNFSSASTFSFSMLLKIGEKFNVV